MLSKRPWMQKGTIQCNHLEFAVQYMRVREACGCHRTYDKVSIAACVGGRRRRGGGAERGRERCRERTSIFISLEPRLARIPAHIPCEMGASTVLLRSVPFHCCRDGVTATDLLCKDTPVG
jgi:hypothetical protein